ncbi:unnamed protein product [Brachionus calyciflorus]|uniref:Uncharacterized protein n=1 Tax=Brachionus calyciflorus TaxID=104777 RepID=A0A813UVY5_9BILA|nr:unnamed protein product [Brachionus calyciflorus]
MFKTLSFILLIVLIDKSFGLKCLSCSSHYDQCGAEINNLDRVAQEKCSSRCFIRTDVRGILTRGCDAGYYFSDDENIPDNGCGYKNEEYWCWCRNSDLCNLTPPKKLFTYDFSQHKNSGASHNQTSGKPVEEVNDFIFNGTNVEN